MPMMTVQKTMRQNFGNWTFLNNLEHTVAILETLVEKKSSGFGAQICTTSYYFGQGP